MIYCISDIHGEVDRFKKMLELIQFSDNDELYIIGDVIDRYPGGIDLLFDIMSYSNMHMIIGNHEQMLLDTLGPENQFGAREMWRANGGFPTYIEMTQHRTPEEHRQIISYLQGLPDHLDIEVSGHRFHLVHGMVGDTRDIRLWDRPEKGMTAPLEGVVAIVGHTPTIFLNNESEDDGEPLRIWYGNGIICIDCGCGYRVAERRLACLRLDDMKEFYV